MNNKKSILTEEDLTDLEPLKKIHPHTWLEIHLPFNALSH